MMVYSGFSQIRVVPVIALLLCVPDGLSAGQPNQRRLVADPRADGRAEQFQASAVSTGEIGSVLAGAASDGIAWLEGEQNTSGTWGGTYDIVDSNADNVASAPWFSASFWLKTHQNADGSWGNVYPFVDTATVVEALAAYEANSTQMSAGGAWLADQSAANNEFLARQSAALSIADNQGLAGDLAAQLLDARNAASSNTAAPNWPEGGWGLAERYETDCLTTALALRALHASGLNGGFEVVNVQLAAGATNIHQWDIPLDATKVRMLITVAGSQIKLCMHEGAPGGPCTSWFPVPVGGPFLITFPDDGLPFTWGQNYVRIESTGLAAVYSLTASYETPTLDTRILLEPLAYLRAAQNGNGGWGLQRGGDTELYTTLHVLLALPDFSNYAVSAEVAAGLNYLRGQQYTDGSFGYNGSPISYVTALAALVLVRSETRPFSADTEQAISALRTMQLGYGSWDEQPYHTALGLLALLAHRVPPTATGDFYTNGYVDGDDHAAFVKCMAGDNRPPAPPPPITVSQCLAAFDFDGDGDVDLWDAGAFTQRFTGPPPPMGACCDPSDGACAVTLATTCITEGHTYLGDDTTCVPNLCPLPPTGACCYSDGTCINQTASACASAGGTHHGNGTTCGQVTCPYGRYRNEIDPITDFFGPGANVAVGDDMTLAGTGARHLVYYDLAVYGGGAGRPLFNVTASLYTACPGAGGTVIPGTTFSWNSLSPNNVVVLSANPASVTIPDTVWMVVTFSTSYAGWIIAGPAEIGSTANKFALNQPPWGCNFIFTGGVPYAGFWANLRAEP